MYHSHLFLRKYRYVSDILFHRLFLKTMVTTHHLCESGFSTGTEHSGKYPDLKKNGFTDT